MANYTQTIRNDNPVIFWTFDGLTQPLVGGQIYNDVNFAMNPLTVFGSNFRVGKESLIEVEQSGHNSMELCSEPYKNQNWENTHLSTPHTYLLGQLVEFTFEFTCKIKSYTSLQYDNGAGYSNHSPLIYKSGWMNLRLFNSNIGRGLTLTMFSGRQDVDSYTITSENLGSDLFNKAFHCVVRNSYTQLGANKYKVTTELFFNSRLVGTHSYITYDTIPQMNNSSNLFLLGNPNGNSPNANYHVSPVKIDQFAIYNYAISDYTLSNHYRKTKDYISLIKTDHPSHYWQMNEAPSQVDTTIHDSTGGVDGNVSGHFMKGVEGSPRIVNSNAIELFGGDGVIKIGQNRDVTHITPTLMQTNGDYTVEFIFKTSQDRIGTLFTTTAEDPQFKGLTVKINSFNGVETPSSIDVYEGHNRFSIDSKPFNGSVWHHIIIRRIDNQFSIYIDNVKEVDEEVPVTSGYKANLLYLLGSPTREFVNGSISEVAIYNYGLSEIQMNNRFNFVTRYIIRGKTFLEGVPIASNVRIYDDFTGDLINEQNTKSDGIYALDVPNDNFVNIIAKIPHNNQIKYRIHAPIKPSEYEDAHDII